MDYEGDWEGNLHVQQSPEPEVSVARLRLYSELGINMAV